MVLVHREIRRKRRLLGEGQPVSALGGRPDDIGAGAAGGVEDGVRRLDIGLEHPAPGVALGRRERGPVDDARGVVLADEVTHLAAVGHVDGPEVDALAFRDLPAGVVEVDADDAVLLGEAVTEPAPGATQATGDDNCLGHTDRNGRRGKCLRAT